MKRHAPVFSLLLAAGLLLFGCATNRGTALTGYGLGALQGDYDYFARILLTENPLVNADRAELTAAISDRRKLLEEGMSPVELYRVLSPIVAMAGCGHSSVRLSNADEQQLMSSGKLLPLLVYVENGRIFVLSAFGRKEPPPESEIVQINGRASADIVKTMLENVTADGKNITKKLRVINLSFAPLYLHLFGSSDRFSVKYARSGETKVVTLDGMKLTELAKLAHQAGPPQIGFPGKTLECTFPSPEVAVLTVRSFNFYDSSSLNDFKGFIDSCFAAIAAHHVSSVILDLRDNWGGDPQASSYLFSYLIRRAEPYFSENTYGYYQLSLPVPVAAQNAFGGKLIVLQNGGSFSSTGHLLALLRYHELGTFVGEESGSSFSSTDGSRDFPLPETRVILHSSRREYRVAVGGLPQGRGILPDVGVSPTAADLIAGRDPAMEAALELAVKTASN
ncbi:MAG TPA: S41 family peptidase [Spirochaetia bacterium]|nr:S41 family peptidase [Spirochaetia bacterium]